MWGLGNTLHQGGVPQTPEVSQFLALILARSSALLPLYSASRITHVLHVRLRFVSPHLVPNDALGCHAPVVVYSAHARP